MVGLGLSGHQPGALRQGPVGQSGRSGRSCCALLAVPRLLGSAAEPLVSTKRHIMEYMLPAISTFAVHWYTNPPPETVDL